MKNVRKGTEYKTKIFVGTDKLDIDLEIAKFSKTHKNIEFGQQDVCKDGDNYVGVIVWR